MNDIRVRVRPYFFYNTRFHIVSFYYYKQERYITIRYYCCYKQDLLVTQKNDLNITIYE